MLKFLMTTTATVLLSAGVSTPAFAGADQTTQQQTAKPAKDPNEVICERQEEIGTRLASQRICKTRAQWAEERRLTRQDVEKAQVQRDLNH